MVVAEILLFIVASIVGIFDVLRNVYLDGISILMLFIAFIVLEILIEFLFDFIGTKKKGKKGSSDSSDVDYDNA